MIKKLLLLSALFVGTSLAYPIKETSSLNTNRIDYEFKNSNLDFGDPSIKDVSFLEATFSINFPSDSISGPDEKAIVEDGEGVEKMAFIPEVGQQDFTIYSLDSNTTYDDFIIKYNSITKDIPDFTTESLYGDGLNLVPEAHQVLVEYELGFLPDEDSGERIIYTSVDGADDEPHDIVSSEGSLYVDGLNPNIDYEIKVTYLGEEHVEIITTIDPWEVEFEPIDIFSTSAKVNIVITDFQDTIEGDRFVVTSKDDPEMEHYSEVIPTLDPDDDSTKKVEIIIDDLSPRSGYPNLLLSTENTTKEIDIPPFFTDEFVEDWSDDYALLNDSWTSFNFENEFFKADSVDGGVQVERQVYFRFAQEGTNSFSPYNFVYDENNFKLNPKNGMNKLFLNPDYKSGASRVIEPNTVYDIEYVTIIDPNDNKIFDGKHFTFKTINNFKTASIGDAIASEIEHISQNSLKIKYDLTNMTFNDFNALLRIDTKLVYKDGEEEILELDKSEIDDSNVFVGNMDTTDIVHWKEFKDLSQHVNNIKEAFTSISINIGNSERDYTSSTPNVVVPPESSFNLWIIILVSVLLFILLLIIGFYFYYKKRHKLNDEDLVDKKIEPSTSETKIEENT